jgi:SAM-dependent methyltransferase
MSKDLFSSQAEDYAKYRPTYPRELFEYIVSFVKRREAALDCATGNGQAALALTPYFKRVFGIDISAKQIEQALPDSKIEYSVASAEATGFPDHSFDLIAVAQAYHWFNFESFAAEVRRIARPDGVVALWGYCLATCEDPKVDALVEKFYGEKVGPYWDPERKYVEDSYATIPFPYHELPSRNFQASLRWNRRELLGYLSTWSSVQHYKKAQGRDPVVEFGAKLEATWPGDAAKHFDFPIFLRIGKIGVSDGKVS